MADRLLEVIHVDVDPGEVVVEVVDFLLEEKRVVDGIILGLDQVGDLVVNPNRICDEAGLFGQELIEGHCAVVHHRLRVAILTLSDSGGKVNPLLYALRTFLRRTR